MLAVAFPNWLRAVHTYRLSSFSGIFLSSIEPSVLIMNIGATSCSPCSIVQLSGAGNMMKRREMRVKPQKTYVTVGAGKPSLVQRRIVDPLATTVVIPVMVTREGPAKSVTR